MRKHPLFGGFFRRKSSGLMGIYRRNKDMNVKSVVENKEKYEVELTVEVGKE